MIVIKENGLAAYFDVNNEGNLYFYGIKNENAPAPATDEKTAANYTAVEIRTTGSNTGRHPGGKAVGFLCPSTIPCQISVEDKAIKVNLQTNHGIVVKVK